MDTEEDLKIQEAVLKGHDLNERCSYQYDARKQSYKEGVAGKLSGALIGAAVGSGIGLAVAMMLAAFTPIALPVLTAVAGFAGAGMLYGAHEFSDSGKMAGASAAVGEKLEFKLKTFMKGQVDELKQEIKGLKAGNPAKASPDSKISASDSKAATAQPAHAKAPDPAHGEECPPVTGGKLVFWKVAATGLLIGMAAGALLAAGGFAGHILEALGGAGHVMAHGAAPYAAAMTSLGLFGASFGVNRDIFWNLSEKAGLLLKGRLFESSPATQPQLAHTPAVEKTCDKGCDKPAINTVVYNSPIDYPSSDTHHRDKAIAAGKAAMMRLDPTQPTVRQRMS